VPHWGDAYYGELYADSVRDLLSPRLSALEAEVIAALLALGPRDRVLDCACGEGRHARVLAPRVGALVGIDRSSDYLRRAASPSLPARYARADVRALPFATGAFDAAYSWYASLFMFDDATNAACLRELARVVRPGGRLLVHHANPLRLALAPHDEAARDLPGGGRVEEVSDFDGRTGVDRSVRRLVRGDGTVVAAAAELRYYSPAEWESLSRTAGLTIVEITTTPRAGERPPGPIGPDAPDLVVLLEKR
jgi:ubiquinone/menaquinone biosynthesis C-methylase UbiE